MTSEIHVPSHQLLQLPVLYLVPIHLPNSTCPNRLRSQSADSIHKTNSIVSFAFEIYPAQRLLKLCNHFMYFFSISHSSKGCNSQNKMQLLALSQSLNTSHNHFCSHRKSYQGYKSVREMIDQQVC